MGRSRHQLAEPAPRSPSVPAGSEVARLLALHAERISEMRDFVKKHPRYDIDVHDDLHLLRFLLSHRLRPAAAARAMAAALEWRAAEGIDEASRRIAAGDLTQKDFVGHAMVFPHLPMHVLVTAEGQPVLFVSLAETDFAALMQQAGALEAYCKYHYLLTEMCALLCDRATRRTGRLVKQHKVIDGSAAAMRHLQMPYLRAVSAAAKESEDAYPQLVGTVAVCNFGPVIRAVFQRVALPLMPERMRSKVAVLEPREDARDRAALARLLPEASTPQALGGPVPLSRDVGGPQLAARGYEAWLRSP